MWLRRPSGDFADGRCVIITTPPDAAISTFGLEDDYAREAQRIGAFLRDIAQRDAGIIIADFAELARPHHLADGTPGDWYAADDDLHPNPEGTAALRTLLLDAAQRCDTSDRGAG
jgi:hypothetical protein